MEEKRSEVKFFVSFSQKNKLRNNNEVCETTAKSNDESI